MISVFQDQSIRTFTPCPARLITICLLFIICTCSCTSQEDTPQNVETTVHLQVDDFEVPRLPSASEQLHFAKIAATDLPHQIALLKAVEQFFPKEKNEVGQADLEITYLQLGSDYRRNSSESLKNTARSYLTIATNHKDIPAVAAKALWYHGWVETDLLKQTSVGRASYQNIIDQYPYEQVSLSPVISWTSINLEQKPTKPATDSSQSPLTWSDLAFLELIRHAKNGASSLDQYRAFCDHAPTSSIMPEALQVLLTRKDIDTETRTTIKATAIRTDPAKELELQPRMKK